LNEKLVEWKLATKSATVEFTAILTFDAYKLATATVVGLLKTVQCVWGSSFLSLKTIHCLGSLGALTRSRNWSDRSPDIPTYIYISTYISTYIQVPPDSQILATTYAPISFILWPRKKPSF
jgi:hypothetical protein